MRRLLIFAASFCFCSSLECQEPVDSSFVITSCRAALQIFPAANGISCTDTLGIRRGLLEKHHLSVRLYRVFSVQAVSLNGKKHDFTRKQDTLEIKDLPGDSTFDLCIGYSGRLDFQSEFTRLTLDRAVLHADDILPAGAMAIESVRISLIVPGDWTALSVGGLVCQEPRNDSTISVWEYTHPIPQIGWICAGKYWSARNRSTDPPIGIHLFAEDSSSAPEILAAIRQIVSFYSERFVPYRFPDLNIVEVDNWVAGRNVLAIAVPSLIMVKQLAFTTADVFNRAVAVLPHEVAHQWWPATVFIRDEDAAFLSEGMCEYSALLYDEAHHTTTIRDSLSRHPLLRPLLMRAEQGNDLPLEQKADLRAVPTQYLKASYVHNMLRQILGDSVFARLYREFALRYGGRRATIDDFRRLAEELSGKNLKWFFDQWLMKKGIPELKIYGARSIRSGSEWETHGRVRVVGYERYSAEIPVGVQTPEGLMMTRVMVGLDSAGNYHNDVPFQIRTSGKPDRAILDPRGDLLKMEKLAPRMSDLRDPADGLMVIGTAEGTAYLRNLAERDSAELDRAGWTVTLKPDSMVTLADLQHERVFLYGKSSENLVVKNLEGRFPYTFRGDSIIVDGAALFDSTAAFDQIVESPYTTAGTLCWIAPLTSRAQPELFPYDASWVMIRGKEVISSGTWEVEDENLVVDIK